ncbi:ArsR/SmtB family transcription factor [Streptomyces sp. NPDC101393]|uniref:ArsR/SmtB family transcription factor n=1 Tax=Streptomyces sp. NPDC101393 TaxID=3366141 RepID=UPI0037FDCF7B
MPEKVLTAGSLSDEPQTADIRLDEVIHAFGDPLRRKIVRHLAEAGEAACGDIALPVTRATGSHHYRILRQAGWTRTRVMGRERYISLRVRDLNTRFPGLLGALLHADKRDIMSAAGNEVKGGTKGAVRGEVKDGATGA